MLAKLGYKLDADELDYVDVQFFSVIANELNRLESEDMKRTNKKR